MSIYKCRFELSVDVDEAISILVLNGIYIKTIYRGNAPFNGEDEWEFECDKNLNEIVKALKKGKDLHIIYESLQLKPKYTGKRDWKRSLD
jgi:hypothetical protein